MFFVFLLLPLFAEQNTASTPAKNTNTQQQEAKILNKSYQIEQKKEKPRYLIGRFYDAKTKRYFTAKYTHISKEMKEKKKIIWKDVDVAPVVRTSLDKTKLKSSDYKEYKRAEKKDALDAEKLKSMSPEELSKLADSILKKAKE